MTDLLTQKFIAAVNEALDEDPSLSTHQLMKRLNNEFHEVPPPPMVTHWRDKWHARRELLRQNDGAIIPTKTYHVPLLPKCSNCGGPHFVSQCKQPFPEKPIQLTQPIAPEAPMNNPAADPNAVSEVSTHAEMHATAPHPDARRRTTAGMMMRRQYVNELLDEDPALHPLVILGKVRERFGIGLDWRYIYDTCRVSREVHRLPQIPPHEITKSRDGAREPLPEFAATENEFADTPDEECLWLAKQANDIMRVHGLTELRLTVDGGKAKWVYKVVTTGEGEVAL